MALFALSFSSTFHIFCPVYYHVSIGDQAVFTELLRLHEAKRPPISIIGTSLWLTCRALSSHLQPLPPMSAESRQSKRRDGVLAGLDVATQLLSVAKDACGFPPAQIALGSACTLLTIIKVHSLLCFEESLLDSYLFRIPWATNRTSSISECSVLM